MYQQLNYNYQRIYKLLDMQMYQNHIYLQYFDFNNKRSHVEVFDKYFDKKIGDLSHLVESAQDIKIFSDLTGVFLSVRKKNNFETKNHSTEDYFQLTSLINEISIHYTPFKHHEETIEDFFSVLKKDYNHLIQLKNDLIKEHKFKESSEIQNQI
jgi:hypothetical protein